MNQTRAEVREGDSVATFEIRKPRWTTQSSIDGKCSGKIMRLTFEAPQGAKMQYMISITLRREPVHRLYSFKLLNGGPGRIGNPQVNTPPDVLKRFDAKFQLAELRFPEARVLPFLEHRRVRLPDGTLFPCYYVTLPPCSSLYTTDRQFLTALGFSPLQYAAKRRQILLRSGQSTGREERVFGFFNYSETNNVTVYAENPMRPDQNLELYLGRDEELHREVQLQMELSDFRSILLPGDREEHPLDQETAIKQLNLLLRAVPGVCNLVVPPVLAYPMTGSGTDPNKYLSRIILVNRPVPNSNAWLEIEMPEYMLTCFELPSGKNLDFLLSVEREYHLEAGVVSRVDPFRGQYPVTILCKNYGEALSWVGGKGYVPLLAVMNDSGWDTSIYSEYTEFNTDTARLSLEFLNFASKPITFERDVNLHLLLKFKFIDSQVPSRARNACRCLQPNQFHQ
jgi:hypothetical protein